MKAKKQVPTEEYVVKFWVKDQETGLSEQREESIYLFSKGKHAAAERAVYSTYRKLGLPITIISVKYQ
jgi:hypothetical protein